MAWKLLISVNTAGLTYVIFDCSLRTKYVEITIETCPDYCLKPHLREQLSCECARIGVRVQNVVRTVKTVSEGKTECTLLLKKFNRDSRL
jgi:hypothetical protein